LLCQRVAMRANHEDEESGHFFQNRFHATRIIDEASLLACAAYVDLNPIRASMAKTHEQSDYTSVQRRTESLASTHDQAVPAAKRRDNFLAPVSIDERSDPIGPCASRSGKRCSDKGFLAMSLEDYLQTLDWTARQIAPGKSGRTPADAPPVLQRLGLDTPTWCELVRDFGRLFYLVAGRPECVDPLKSRKMQRRYHLRRRARELLTRAD
ncbi:MAG: hypothetical protein ACF788_13970, partial [Novipirellula sp. JB048]